MMMEMNSWAKGEDIKLICSKWKHSECSQPASVDINSEFSTASLNSRSVCPSGAKVTPSPLSPREQSQ